MVLKKISDCFNIKGAFLPKLNLQNTVKNENNCLINRNNIYGGYKDSGNKHIIMEKNNGISKSTSIKKYENNISNGVDNVLGVKNMYNELFSPIKQLSIKELKNFDFKRGLHIEPKNMPDSIAYSIVKTLRFFADLYFKKDYVRRAVVLETVAAIPGMVGGLFHHLYSLRSLEDNKERIQDLLGEAENERQHLLTFLELLKPNILDRIIIRITQALFFNTYMVVYFLFPRTCHRFVGYLEEEAIRSYTAFEDEIKLGNIKNIRAPQISIDYWNLPKNARLLDVVRAVRADEANHRDVNHEIADKKPFSFNN